MKKSATILNYAPPTLTYEHNQQNNKKISIKPTTPATARTISNTPLLTPYEIGDQETLQNSGSDQNLQTIKNPPNRIMSKYKTQQRIGS